MTVPKTILWYGLPPQPGVLESLQKRGFTVEHGPKDTTISDALMRVTEIVIFNYGTGDIETDLAGYKHLPKFINHGILILILVANIVDWPRIREAHLNRIDSEFNWDQYIVFLNNITGVNFDNIVAHKPSLKWRGIDIKKLDLCEELTAEEKLLIDRAFQYAQEVHIREIKGGFTESRVFMAYEKRNVSSIAHWTQPRLVKIGYRKDLAIEVGNMKEVSPFVPFELRPNLEVYVEGFKKSVYVADFVDKSESMLEVARSGRAEAAISNLFNRTLHRWRDRAWQCGSTDEPLVTAAERLGMISPKFIKSQYLESAQIQSLDIDINKLWSVLASIRFEHRAASIHGDLHGDNVRVRGDDAILIDLGSVKGIDEPGKGAPLCFDVAMLEVALVFTYTEDENKNIFQQPEWEKEIRPFYKLNAISSTPDRDSAPKPDSWLFGCLQRVRAFGIYEQSNPLEYAVALVIAMWRLCKFESTSPADKGRRVVALQIGAEIINEIKNKMESSV